MGEESARDALLFGDGAPSKLAPEDQHAHVHISRHGSVAIGVE
jgi:hypothetical protein